MKSRALPLVFALAAIAIISAASSFLTLRVVNRNSAQPAVDYHTWIHKKLEMTPEQERRSLISERRYEETKRHLDEVIRLANGELAENIFKDKSYSPQVEKSVAEIHTAMGQLQKATLEHIFELREVLDAAQYERLLELTVQGLTENTRQD
ncbi:MAG: periplasmic heavy metal sensor [Proteobacteria bacterium]|nr:periplasmic heavy metal sensor [Pseudomonadota bacterium]